MGPSFADSIMTCVPSQRQIGCGGLGSIQEWHLNSMSEDKMIVTMRGKVNGLQVNEGGWWPDEDQNICVNPFESYEWIGVNRWGDKNKRHEKCGSSGELPAGTVEMEVNSYGNSLSGVFPVGTKIEAGGWWVYDTGHNWDLGKPAELHPVRYVMSYDANPFSLFVSNDSSGRFITSSCPFWESFSFDLVGAGKVVTPQSLPPSETTVLKEASTLVDGSALMSLMRGSSHLSIDLKPQPNNCEGGNTGSLTTSTYYLGQFQESHPALVTDQMTYSVATDGAGKKTVMAKIKTELKPGSVGKLALVRWWYESSAGLNTGVVTTDDTTAPYPLEFVMPYAPRDGFVKNFWTVDVMASTKAETFGVSPTNVAPGSLAIDRTVLGERRIYTVTPSALQLSQYDKYDAVACWGDVYLNVVKKLVHPQVDIRNIVIEAKKVRKGSGAQVSPDPNWTVITGASSLSDNDVKVQMSGADRVQVSFANLGQGVANRAAVKVKVRGESEIGEIVSAGAEARMSCKVGKYDAKTISGLIGRFFASKKYAAEPEELLKKAAPADRAGLEAYLRWMSGQELSASHQSALTRVLTTAEKLPAPKPDVRKATDLRPSPQRVVVTHNR
jgi:hypothetical protein